MSRSEFEIAAAQMGLSPDQVASVMYDADETLADAMQRDSRIVPPGPETMQRVEDPLSEDIERNFGDYALRAIERYDRDFSELDDRSSRI
jgi:hypothetical protein